LPAAPFFFVPAKLRSRELKRENIFSAMAGARHKAKGSRVVRGLGFTLILGCLLHPLPGFAQTAPSPSAIRQNALALEQQGRNDEAASQWRALLKLAPSDPEPYAHLGLIESRQGNFKEAAGFYRKALSIGPKLPSVELNLGLALFKGGELKEAADVFQPMLHQLPPASAQAQQVTLLLGMSYYGMAQYAQAVPYLKAAEERDPQSLPLLLALAHSYLWSRQFKAVMDVYQKILAVNPDSAEADMLAGEALDEMKDNEGSTKMFRAAVAANPKEPNAHFGLGYLLWTQKQYPEAAREFEAELANDPNHAQAMLYLADSRMQLNQPDQARPLLEKVETLDPSLPLAHLDLGILYTDAGDNAAALRELERAEKLIPDDVNVHWRLGRLYRAMGKKEEARAEFDKASTLNKAADEDLYKKIASGAARGPHSNASPSTPGDTTTPAAPAAQR
jgi:tetratricopeptide (TPR) repeat protein